MGESSRETPRDGLARRGTLPRHSRASGDVSRGTVRCFETGGPNRAMTTFHRRGRDARQSQAPPERLTWNGAQHRWLAAECRRPGPRGSRAVAAAREQAGSSRGALGRCRAGPQTCGQCEGENVSTWNGARYRWLIAECRHRRGGAGTVARCCRGPRAGRGIPLALLGDVALGYTPAGSARGRTFHVERCVARWRRPNRVTSSFARSSVEHRAKDRVGRADPPMRTAERGHWPDLGPGLRSELEQRRRSPGGDRHTAP